jgi:hypothetical protein
VTARLGPLLRATVGGIAMSASLPGGHAASAAYWYRQLRKEGADGGLAALAMVGSMLAGVRRPRNEGLRSTVPPNTGQP